MTSHGSTGQDAGHSCNSSDFPSALGSQDSIWVWQIHQKWILISVYGGIEGCQCGQGGINHIKLSLMVVQENVFKKVTENVAG